MNWIGAATVVLLCLLSLAPTSAQPANYIIVPGVSVGDIQLGWTQRQVLNRLGMPEEISNDRGTDGTQNVYWVYPQDDRRVLVVSWTKRSGEAGGVDFIFTDAAKYVTSRGIAMQNSTFKEILEKYTCRSACRAPAVPQSWSTTRRRAYGFASTAKAAR